MMKFRKYSPFLICNNLHINRREYFRKNEKHALNTRYVNGPKNMLHDFCIPKVVTGHRLHERL
jgi:hypothetical protein